MARIITVAHQKGGVGKSTLVLNLAYIFSKQMRTALADIDPQGSIIQLQDIIKDVDIIEGKYLDELSASDLYDIIFVDTPPYLTDALLPLFTQSDLVLIPTKAGVPDIMAIRATIELVQVAQRRKSSLKSAIVLNMVKPRASVTWQAKEQLSKYKLAILAEIKDRVSYNNTFLLGGDFFGVDVLAQQEIEYLSNEIIRLMQ